MCIYKCIDSLYHFVITYLFTKHQISIPAVCYLSFSTCNRVGKQTPWILIRLQGCAGWSGSMLVANYYVGFVVMRLIFTVIVYVICLKSFNLKVIVLNMFVWQGYKFLGICPKFFLFLYKSN
jgi:hypothetical protein